jgi:hypothetical protein
MLQGGSSSGNNTEHQTQLQLETVEAKTVQLSNKF